MSKATINLDYLRAISYLPDPKETRRYCTGVHLYLTETSVTYVGFCGTRILVVRDDLGDKPQNDFTGRISMTVADAQAIKIPTRRYASRYATLIRNDGYMTLDARGTHATHTFAPVDGLTVPDWRRLFPADAGDVDTLPTGLTIDPKHLTPFYKAAEVMGTGGPAFRWRGGNMVIVTYRAAPHIIGGVMPLKMSAPEYSRPAWLDNVEP